MTKELQSIADDAYIFGLPLVFSLEQIEKSLNKGFGRHHQLPYNAFKHQTELADATNQFVSVNNDTAYSVASLDLSVGPIKLEIPEINRYYVFQFVDAWTNNFAYLGERSLGEKGGKFYILPPNYTGTIPEGYIPIQAPTRLVEIVGRILVLGNKDLPNVKKIQDQIKLEVIYSDKKPNGVPKVSTSSTTDLLFWQKFHRFLKDNPPAARYQKLLVRYKELGIFADDDFYDHVSDELRVTLKRAISNGQRKIHDYIKGIPENTQNGWQMNYHIFDYNFDYFELGTVNQAKWLLPHETESDLKSVNLQKAAAAIGGLWGLQAYEAVYLSIFVDSHNQQLNGKNQYRVTFKQTPPTDGFWSITMYEAENFTLVDNIVNKYSVGDRTSGLHFNSDGSLTIVFSNEAPRENKENWLPTPEGDFRPILRIYKPKEKVLNNQFVFPKIERIL